MQGNLLVQFIGFGEYRPNLFSFGCFRWIRYIDGRFLLILVNFVQLCRKKFDLIDFGQFRWVSVNFVKPGFKASVDLGGLGRLSLVVLNLAPVLAKFRQFCQIEVCQILAFLSTLFTNHVELVDYGFLHVQFVRSINCFLNDVNLRIKVMANIRNIQTQF